MRHPVRLDGDTDDRELAPEAGDHLAQPQATEAAVAPERRDVGGISCARQEQQRTVKEDDAAEPFPIGDTLLGSRFTKFLRGQGVGAMTGVVTIRKHAIPLC